MIKIMKITYFLLDISTIFCACKNKQFRSILIRFFFHCVNLYHFSLTYFLVRSWRWIVQSIRSFHNSKRSKNIQLLLLFINYICFSRIYASPLIRIIRKIQPPFCELTNKIKMINTVFLLPQQRIFPTQ